MTQGDIISEGSVVHNIPPMSIKPIMDKFNIMANFMLHTRSHVDMALVIYLLLLRYIYIYIYIYACVCVCMCVVCMCACMYA